MNGPLFASEREHDRLDAHFDWVLTLLRAQRVEEWPAERRAARAQTLGRLERYKALGRFPRNTARRDRMAPAFIDLDGTTCAVAHLLLTSGRSEFAAALHREMNLAYVAEMPAGELAAWAHEAGLTVEEVQLIQPDYCPQPQNPCMIGGSCGPAGCQCPAWTQRPDGSECDFSGGGCVTALCNAGLCEPLDHPCDDGDALTTDVCRADGCAHEPVSAEEDETGGCAVITEPLDPSTGSAAPLLAALFLLGLVARRARHGSRAGASRRATVATACSDQELDRG